MRYIGIGPRGQKGKSKMKNRQTVQNKRLVELLRMQVRRARSQFHTVFLQNKKLTEDLASVCRWCDAANGNNEKLSMMLRQVREEKNDARGLNPIQETMFKQIEDGLSQLRKSFDVFPSDRFTNTMGC